MPIRMTPLVIGIAGGSGSGKTTVANMIIQHVGAEKIAYLPHDAYYKDLSNLPEPQRHLINFDHPNSLETSLLIQHVIQLKKTNQLNYPFMISAFIAAPIKHNASNRKQSSLSRASIFLPNQSCANYSMSRYLSIQTQISASSAVYKGTFLSEGVQPSR